MRINYKEGICSQCNKPNLIVQKSLNLCVSCNQKRLIKKYRENRKKKVSDGQKADKTKLQSFYREVWDRNPHFCYETESPLWRFKSWHVHHVLHKEDYPQLAFNHDVCVLLTLEQHSLWHTLAPSDRAKYMPKTYAKYLSLCETYEVEAKF